MAELRFSMEPHDAGVVVAVSGELDIVNSQQFDDYLSDASADRDLVVLDMSAVDFMDTSALAVIVGHWRRQEERPAANSCWPGRVTGTQRRSGSPALPTGCRCTTTSPRRSRPRSRSLPPTPDSGTPGDATESGNVGAPS